MTRVIGYWIRNLKDEEFCAPQEVVGNLPREVRSKLADYLDGGSIDPLNSQCGYSWCRFFCGVSNERMGSKELTDGFWSWPEGLSHYVRAHGIILPEEFVAHALANGVPRPPRQQIKQPSRQVTPSLDFWRKWCSTHRAPAFLERLRRARAEADARARVVEREEIQRRVSDEIARYGLGDARCIFVGCQERVLSGRKLCARHMLKDTNHIADGCYSITPQLVTWR